MGYVTLFILLLYIAAVPQCEGCKESSSYNYCPSKSNEKPDELLMEISEKLGQIILQLNQQKQQQPVYVPTGVPHFVRHEKNKNRKKTIGTTRTALKKDDTQSEITIKVSENEGGLKTDPVKDIEGNRIESLQDVPNTSLSEPLKCKIATVACCRFPEYEQKRNCFAFYTCTETFNNNRSCQKEAIDRAVTSVVNKYEPMKNDIYMNRITCFSSLKRACQFNNFI